MKGIAIMFSPHTLIIIGIMLVALAIVGLVIYMGISRKSKTKLEKELDLEYGKRRN